MFQVPILTKLYDPSELLIVYPEQNLFHLDPPPYGLTPLPVRSSFDTEEFRQAALAIAHSTGVNPLRIVYFSHPLRYRNSDHEKDSKLPFSAYRRPDVLSQITLPEDTVFLKQIWRHAEQTALFIVRVAGEVRLLKVSCVGDFSPPIPPQWPEQQTNRTVPTDLSGTNGSGDPQADSKLATFEQELEGYAHLQHYGVIEKGVVPRCYGWLTLSPTHITQILKLPRLSKAAKSMEPHARAPPRAILLEYVADAQPLTIDNATDELANATLRGLAEIHSAYVVHGDVHNRHILVAPGDRVVWVDFGRSRTPAGELEEVRCCRQDLFDELASGWSFLYEQLLPDRRIGHRQWVPPTSSSESDDPELRD
ncbi:hypothetical protein FKP32DRAFT_1605067 [Trametes sanguinea]|nr:hypothetical protein FKP32DRAFT_1605067 [Trametes sanguinea]